jgi:hypothetical protein
MLMKGSRTGMRGNTTESTKCRRLAHEAAHGIQDREDREQFLSDLQASPWY